MLVKARQNEDGQVLKFGLGSHLFDHLQPAHLRKLKVKLNDIGIELDDFCQPGDTIKGVLHIITRKLVLSAVNAADHHVVFNYQNAFHFVAEDLEYSRR